MSAAVEFTSGSGVYSNINYSISKLHKSRKIKNKNTEAIPLKMCKELNKHPTGLRAIMNYNCPAALLVGVAIVTRITQLEKSSKL